MTLLEMTNEIAAYTWPGAIAGAVLAGAYMLGRAFKRFFDDALELQRESAQATRELAHDARDLIDAVTTQTGSVTLLIDSVRTLSAEMRAQRETRKSQEDRS